MDIPRSKSAAPGSSSFVINSKRAIGLELELSNFGHWSVYDKYAGQLPGNGPKYNVAHDGSVRPSQLEAVFEPLAGDHDIIHGLNSIANQVYINGCEVNETCGYHVHVDARDFSWTDIQKFLYLWLGIEQHSSIWVLGGRISNNYCRPWTNYWMSKQVNLPIDLYEFRRMIFSKLYGYDIAKFNEDIANTKSSSAYIRYVNNCKLDNVKPKSVIEFCGPLQKFTGLKKNRGWNRSVDARYLDVNIHSWIYRGTIEYRLGAGTVDVDRIRMWPIFCLWLTEAAIRTNLSIIKKHYYDDNSSNINVLMKIIDMGGILIPSITGPKLYPMPVYLQQWCKNVLNDLGHTVKPQPDLVISPIKPTEVKPKFVKKPSINNVFVEELARELQNLRQHTATYTNTTFVESEDQPF